MQIKKNKKSVSVYMPSAETITQRTNFSTTMKIGAIKRTHIPYPMNTDGSTKTKISACAVRNRITKKVSWPSLTDLCRVVSSITTLWTSLFPVAGCLVSFYYYYIL